MDDDFNERLKAFKRELRELGEDVEQLRKRKANGEDVEQIASKVSALETEVRTKFGSLQSQNSEIQQALQSVLTKLDALSTDLSHQKREVNNLQETNKGSVWSRIPMMAWALMAIGGFAVLQLGLERWAEFQGMGR